MKALNLANASTIHKRRALDYYPTPPDVTHALMNFLSLEPCRIWEPACGDGAMAKVLAEYGHDIFSSDIRETGYGQGGVDFLATTHEYSAIITNPPFALSEAFIRHALPLAETVAMLLKSQYWHAAKRKALFEEYPPAYVLPLTWRPDFMNNERGGSPTMDVHWTVWKSGQTDTKYRLLAKRINDGQIAVPPEPTFEGREVNDLASDAARYRWLRERDLETISKGGVFAGMTPRNVVLNGKDLDAAIDAAMPEPTLTKGD